MVKSLDKIVYRYTRVFFAMVLILLHNQFVYGGPLVSTGDPLYALRWLPAFIGYFVLIIDVKEILSRPWTFALMSLLLLGGVGNAIGFFMLLSGDRFGILPVLNLLGHVGAVWFLALWTQLETKKAEDVSYLPWLAACILLLLFDLWLILNTCMNISQYSGAQLRLIPSVIILVALYSLHMRAAVTSSESVRKKDK